VLELQNSILRERDPASRAAARAKRAQDDVRQALRLPETSAWTSASPTSKDAGASRGAKRLDASSRDISSRIAADAAEGSSAEGKGVSRLLSSVMSEVAGKQGTRTQNSSMMVTIGADGVDVQRGPAKTILQSQLDWELSSFREQVDAIRMSTEELIKDVNRWRPADHRLPYSSVHEFRAYVLVHIFKSTPCGDFTK
jgi:hypothetical protein